MNEAPELHSNSRPNALTSSSSQQPRLWQGRASCAAVPGSMSYYIVRGRVMVKVEAQTAAPPHSLNCHDDGEMAEE